MKTNPFLIFDFDSTVIQLESLEVIADFALRNNAAREGILAEISAITNLGMEGKIDFKQSLQKRLGLFAINKTDIDSANQKIADNITPSFLKNIDFIRDQSDRIYIISGGFHSNVLPVANIFGISPDHILANRFVFDAQANVCGIDENSPLLFPRGKSLAVSNLNLSGDIIVIGDGYTDYQIKEAGACQHFIAFCENIRREKVAEKADFIAQNLDEVIQIISRLQRV